MTSYESYLQYPLHYNAAVHTSAGYPISRERIAGLRAQHEAAEGAAAAAMAQAASAHGGGVSSAAAQRERFLLRIRREMQMLASEHHNAICAARAYFPHLFSDSTAAVTTAAQDTGDGPEEGDIAVAGSNDVRSISPVHQQPALPLQSSSESPPIAPASSSLSAASATALAPSHAAAAPGAGFVFPSLPQLSPPHWRDRCINYDMLRTQMKKVVYIQNQIAAFIAEQQQSQQSATAEQAPSATAISHEADSRKEALMAQQAAADEADAARRARRDRTPRPPDSLSDRDRVPTNAGDDAEPPKDSSALISSAISGGGANGDSSLPPGLSRAILASLRAHPSFQMLRQAHQAFWALLKTELAKSQAFLKDPAHAARTEQLWEQMKLQSAAAPVELATVKQEKSAEDMSNSPNAGAAVEPAADAAASSPAYLSTCPCGCSASLADAFNAVVHELASTGVSARASAPTSSSSTPLCPSAKECAQKFFVSLLHLDQCRKFLTVNGVIYCRLLDQFQHYTAPSPLLEAYQNAILQAERMEQAAAVSRSASASSSTATSAANSKVSSPQLKALAAAGVKSEEQDDTRMASNSPNADKSTLIEAAVESEVPPAAADLPAHPAPSLNMHATHLAAFLGSDPQWPFAPMDTFARLLQRAESLTSNCFGVAPHTYPNVGQGMEGLIPLVPPPCGVCHVAEMSGPTLLPCAHQFCLGCLARQPGFGVCCPLPSCGKEVSSSSELLSRISGEELLRAEESKIRRSAAISAPASAPLSAGVSKRGSMRVDVPPDVPPVVAPPNPALQAQTELTHEQMQLQRKLLQLHFQQLQAAQAASANAAPSLFDQTPAAAMRMSPTISSFSAMDADDPFLGSHSSVLPAVLPTDQQTQAQIQQLYQTAAASQAKQQAALIAQQKHNQRQLAALQQNLHHQQGNQNMSTSVPHSPVHGAAASGQRSAIHSRSGSVTSSMDGGDLEYQQQASGFAATAAHGAAGAAPDLSSYPAPQMHLQRSDENSHLISAHQPRDGDERPLTDEDLSSGNFVSGCGGTVAAPLQYEEVSVVGADGTVSKLMKPKRGQGYSCHHCKTTKEPAVLFFCSNLVKKGVNLKKCKKKVCESCLRRLYSPEFADGGRYWSCPSCKGLCVCASCERKITGRAAPKKKKAGQVDPPEDPALAGALLTDPNAPEGSASTPAHSRTLSGSKRAAGGGEGPRGKGRSRSNSHSAIQLAAVAAAAAAAAGNVDELSIHQQLALERAAAAGHPHPRNAAAIIAARHIAQSAHEFSPLSPLTGHPRGHGGGGSERSSPVPGASPLKKLALARGGSHGDLLSSTGGGGGRGSSRSRKGSNALSRGTTPTQQMLGLGLAGSAAEQSSVQNPPPHHRAQTMHHPPMHGGPHAPLSPSMSMMQGLNSSSGARRASAASTSAPSSHSTSPFHGSFSSSQPLGLSLNSSTVVSDSSDADVTSPSQGGGGPHTRSVSPPALGTNSRQMHEYMHVKNMGLARHTQHQSQLQLHLQQQAQQQQQHQQQQHNPHNLLMSPPGPVHAHGAHNNPLMSPIYPASHYAHPPATADSASSGSGGLFSPPSSTNTTTGVLSSPLSSTVTVAGMNARDLSRLSLGELQAMNDRIEQQLAQLSAQTAMEGPTEGEDGGGSMVDDLAGAQQQHHSSQQSHAFSLLSPPAIHSTSLFQSSPPLCVGGGSSESVSDMGLSELHKMESMLKAQQEKLNREQAHILAQAEEISLARKSLPAKLLAQQQAQAQAQFRASPPTLDSNAGSQPNSARLLPERISISGADSSSQFHHLASAQQQQQRGAVLETPLPLHPPSSLLSLPRTGGAHKGGSNGSGGGTLSPLDVPLMSPGLLDSMMSPGFGTGSALSHSGSGLGMPMGLSPFLAGSSTSVPMAASTPAAGVGGAAATNARAPAASDPTRSAPNASAPLNIQLVTPLGATMHVADNLAWPHAQSSQGGSNSSMLSTPAPGGLRSSSGAHGVGAGSSSMLTPSFRAGAHSGSPLMGGMGLQWDSSGLAHTPGPPLLNASASPGVPMSPAQ